MSNIGINNGSAYNIFESANLDQEIDVSQSYETLSENEKEDLAQYGDLDKDGQLSEFEYGGLQDNDFDGSGSLDESEYQNFIFTAELADNLGNNNGKLDGREFNNLNNYSNAQLQEFLPSVFETYLHRTGTTERNPFETAKETVDGRAAGQIDGVTDSEAEGNNDNSLNIRQEQIFKLLLGVVGFALSQFFGGANR